MKRALNEFLIEGIKTTIPFQLEVIDHAAFKNGNYSIRWVEDYLASKAGKPEASKMEPPED